MVRSVVSCDGLKSSGVAGVSAGRGLVGGLPKRRLQCKRRLLIARVGPSDLAVDPNRFRFYLSVQIAYQRLVDTSTLSVFKDNRNFSGLSSVTQRHNSSIGRVFGATFTTKANGPLISNSDNISLPLAWIGDVNSKASAGTLASTVY